MNPTRRNLLSVTAAGLIHVAARPSLALADGDPPQPLPSELLIRRARERGHTDLGWLHSFHSFSFGDYYDQRHMGFRSFLNLAASADANVLLFDLG